MPSVSVTPNLSAPFAKTAPPGARTPSPASDFRVNTSPIFSRLSRFIVRAPARALLGLIWLYQRTLSPALPVVLGPHCGCRFSPTCSHYAAEAVRTHGALFGSLLTLRRLVKCTPLHPGGFDPVPPSAGIRRTGLARRGLVCRRTNLPTGA